MYLGCVPRLPCNYNNYTYVQYSSYLSLHTCALFIGVEPCICSLVMCTFKRSSYNLSFFRALTKMHEYAEIIEYRGLHSGPLYIAINLL